LHSAEYSSTRVAVARDSDNFIEDSINRQDARNDILLFILATLRLAQLVAWCNEKTTRSAFGFGYDIPLDPLRHIGNPDNAAIAMSRPFSQSFRAIQNSDIGTPNPSIRCPRANPQSVYARPEDISRDFESGDEMAAAYWRFVECIEA
jgi:hypothetical protein